MAFTRAKNNGNESTATDKGRVYGAPDMVERHYVPFRLGNLLPGERTEIESLAAAYKLDEKGLEKLADYMNSVSHKVHNVPPRANEVAMELAGVRPRKPSKPEPYVMIHPEFETAQKENFF
jgi:hypothetical protein